MKTLLDGLYREITAIQGAPAEFASFVTQETEKWTRVVKEAGIKAK